MTSMRGVSYIFPTHCYNLQYNCIVFHLVSIILTEMFFLWKYECSKICPSDTQIGILLSTFCKCSGLPKLQALLNNKPVVLLMDTGASASVISMKLLNDNFPDLGKKIQPAGFSLFVANKLKLHIEGTIVLQLEIGSLKIQCSFVVIAESLSYAIIG